MNVTYMTKKFSKVSFLVVVTTDILSASAN